MIFAMKKKIKRTTETRKQSKSSTDDFGVLTAKSFIQRLNKHRSAAELKKIQRYFKSDKGEYGEGDRFIGVRMGQVFALAKEFAAMPAAEIETLLESPIHEARAGAVSIMDKVSRDKKTTPDRLKEVYDLYMRRHERINNWDLVDLGCLYMVGKYLYDKPREVLYKLARSKKFMGTPDGHRRNMLFLTPGRDRRHVQDRRTPH